VDGWGKGAGVSAAFCRLELDSCILVHKLVSPGKEASIIAQERAERIVHKPIEQYDNWTNVHENGQHGKKTERNLCTSLNTISPLMYTNN
jgi:hypothetical protein